jgi:predicted GNAT family acetyltransferase
MEIRKVTYKEVEKTFKDIKPDLLDESAIYYGCLIKDELVGIVSYVEHPSTIYLCHAYVSEEYRSKGIYKLLWEYRDQKIKDTQKTIYAHCNVNSLKHFINGGYHIEKALFKVVKNKL